MTSTGSATLTEITENDFDLDDGRLLRVTFGMLALYPKPRRGKRGDPLWKTSISQIGPKDVEEISVNGDRADLIRRNTILVSRSIKDGTPC